MEGPHEHCPKSAHSTVTKTTTEGLSNDWSQPEAEESL